MNYAIIYSTYPIIMVLYPLNIRVMKVISLLFMYMKKYKKYLAFIMLGCLYQFLDKFNIFFFNVGT